MSVKSISSPFGGQTRTRTLLALRLVGESYPRELARILDAPLSGVQQALRGLESDGLVVGRTLGRTRVVQLNPRYFAADALGAYLLRLTAPEVELRDRVSAMRKRPRISGKPGMLTVPTRKGFGRTRPMRISGPPVSRAILEDRR
jgi:hypothetical protein